MIGSERTKFSLNSGEQFPAPTFGKPREKMHHEQSLRPVRALAFIACASMGLLWSTAAFAQWLPDRNYKEGPGIRVGDLELHPGFALRAGYDTNVFRQDKNTVGSGILAATPHLNISTLSRQRKAEGEEAAGAAAAPSLPAIAFNAGLAATLFYFFEKDAPSNVEVDTTAALSVLPERPLGFDLGIDYGRNTRPFTAYTGTDDRQKYAFDRIRPQVNLRAQSRSGVLRGNAQYAPIVTIFEDPTFKYLNVIQHEVNVGSAWKFLPYTAFLYDAGLSFVRYDDPTQPQAVVRLTDSERFQTRVGLNGAVTPLLSVRALVGYAVVHNKIGQFDDKEDGVGEAVLAYGNQTASIEGGYQRTMQVVSIGSWMRLDRGYIKGSALLARSFSLNIEGGVGRAKYGKIIGANGAELGVDRDTNLPTFRREDLRIDGGVHAEYRATNWFAILGDFTAFATLTDYRFDAGNVPLPAQFVSYQAFGGVRVFY